MAVAAPLMIAGAGMQMYGQMKQQEAQNAARYAQWLQGEHQQALKTDRQNEKINEQMQLSIKRNSQIADASLSQQIFNSQAVTKNFNDKDRMINAAARRGLATQEASASSRGLSTDSGSARALKRAQLQANADQLASLDSQLDQQLMQIDETRKGQLAKRDFNTYAPNTFAGSRAPTAQDNTIGILGGGLMSMAGIAGGAGYFGGGG